MKLNKRSFCIGMVSSILTNHFEEQVFLKAQSRCVDFAFPSTAEIFSLWSIEFEKYFTKKFKRWDYQLEKGIQPLSWQVREIKNLENLIIDFGYHKFNHM